MLPILLACLPAGQRKSTALINASRLPSLVLSFKRLVIFVTAPSLIPLAHDTFYSIARRGGAWGSVPSQGMSRTLTAQTSMTWGGRRSPSVGQSAYTGESVAQAEVGQSWNLSS